MVTNTHGAFRPRTKPIALTRSLNTVLDREVPNRRNRLAELRFPVAKRRNSESILEERSRVIVWWLIALIWILFLVGGILLWNKTAPIS